MWQLGEETELRTEKGEETELRTEKGEETSPLRRDANVMGRRR
jgi:hypothetical protein